MASPLKLSIKASFDVSDFTTGAQTVRTGMEGLGNSATNASAGMQKLVAAQAGFARASAGAADKAADIAAYGRELDNLRARFNPLYNSIRQYKATVLEIQAAHKVGAISTAEMTAAIGRERQATLASIEAIKGRNAAIRATPAMPASQARTASNNTFQTANIAAQFQDIGVTAAMGMSPLQIALQQGTQLSAVIGSMENPVKGLGAAFMSMVSPVSLVTIAAVGLSAAMAQYFLGTEDKAKSTDDLLKEHQDAIKRIRDVWGEAADQRSRYGRQSSTSAAFGLETNISDLTKKLVEANSPTTFGPGEIGEAITTAISSNRDLTGMGVREFRGSEIFKTLQVDLEALQKATLAGKPEVLGLIQNLEEVGRKSDNAGIKKMAADAVAALRPFKDLAEALRDAELERRRLFETVGPNGMLLSQGTANRADMGNYAAMMTAEKIRLVRERKAAIENQQAELAITPDQKQAAARSMAGAQYDNSESPAARRQRIELAGLKALATAEAEVVRAQRERVASMDRIVEARQSELAMIGKSASEQERLQFETKALEELKTAARQGGFGREQIDDETALIRKQAQEVGELSARISAKKILSDQTAELQKLEQERSLIGTSTEERIRATSAMEAEQQIRDRGIGLLDKEAAGIRDNAKAIAEKRIELGRLAAAETLSRQRAAFDATQQSALARSPQEKAAAARAVASAQVSPGEDPAVRAQRIELAGKQALLQAEQQLSQAREERARSLQVSIDQQAFEVTIVGKSAAEQERLRTEYRLTAEVRAEAARNGTVADEKEIELIRQKTAELARLKAEAGAQTLLKDQATELQKLELERQLIGATAQERARAMAAMEAEQQIREHGIDAMSREAQAIRDNAARIADAKLQVEQMSAAWNEAQQAGMSAIDKLTAGIGDLNADWKSIAKDALDGILDTFKELSIANPLKNAIYGTNLPTTTSMGGVGGFLGALTGQKPTLPGASAITSTGSMNVTAASVSINGTAVGSGGLLGALTGNTATVPSNGASAVAANGLAAAAAASPVTGAAGDVQSTAWNYFAAKGLPPHQIAGILGNMKAESAFNPQAVGDNGHALGLFQWNDRAPAMLNAIGGRQNLGDVNKQLDFAWQEMQTSENPAFQRLRASTDVRSATAAFAGFERPRGYSLANPEGAHNFSGRYAGAEQAMAKFSTNTNTAATSLNTLDSGVTDTAKALTSGSGSLTQSASALATQTQALPQQTEGLFSSMTSSLSKGIGSLTSGIGGLFSNLLGGLFADGAAFSGGNVIAFAGGGVVTSPTPFPMAGGRVGLMGEAGAEAIMPLKRGRDGKLGVTMAYPQQAAGRRDESRRGPQPIHMTFDSNVVVSGNGDKELMDRMHIAVDEKVKRWGESFSQSVLPRRINEIRSDPYAVG